MCADQVGRRPAEVTPLLREARGLDPTAEPGRGAVYDYSTWRALLDVLHDAGFNVPMTWVKQDGVGLEDLEHCRRLADRLERYLDTHGDEAFVWQIQPDTGLPPNITTTASMPSRVSVLHVEEGAPAGPFSIRRGEVAAFAAFLRDSGGFTLHTLNG